MSDLNDTIVAVSSPTSDQRVIVRLSGTGAAENCLKILNLKTEPPRAGVFQTVIEIDKSLTIDAAVYVFLSPHSYTAEDVIEIHYFGNRPVTELLLKKLLTFPSARLAGAGEFTQRAYLNGKLDLAQAEAVNEIITASNRYQLSAAEKLLEGRLQKTIENIRTRILELLSLLEAGIDFAEEDIEVISAEDAAAEMDEITQLLKNLISQSIDPQAIASMPAIAIAGASNAGKSSLLNCLLGKERSIVSGQRKTTRDILSGKSSLANFDCVFFDCAGLITDCTTLIDQLAQKAAIEAIKNAVVTAFCVDITKDDIAEDTEIFSLIENRNILAIATKEDMLPPEKIEKKLVQLNDKFNLEFLPISTKTGSNINAFKDKLDKKLTEILVPAAQRQDLVTINLRHKETLNTAINDLSDAKEHIKENLPEVAAMLLRTSWQNLGQIESESPDEDVLKNIFNKFCIGK